MFIFVQKTRKNLEIQSIKILELQLKIFLKIHEVKCIQKQCKK